GPGGTLSVALVKGLAQKVSIYPWIAVRDYNGANKFLIKLNRPCPADDAIDITQVTQSKQASKQQRLPKTATSPVLHNSRRTEEASTRAFVSRETHNLLLSGGDKNRHRFVYKADRDFVGPRARKLLLDKTSHGRNLEGLRSTNHNV